MSDTVTAIHDRLDAESPLATWRRYPYGSIEHANEGSIARAMRDEIASRRAGERVNARYLRGIDALVLALPPIAPNAWIARDYPLPSPDPAEIEPWIAAEVAIARSVGRDLDPDSLRDWILDRLEAPDDGCRCSSAEGAANCPVHDHGDAR